MTDAPVRQPDHALDTVDAAAAAPDQEMPYAALGLKPDEYADIVSLLGRRPTAAELAMYSVMWSEHCSYKSSKIHLKQFGEKTTEAMKERLMVGMGENAGVVDIGDGWAVTFKVESHNHPSYVEPHQGAATGVGGIVRDILAMGARPVAAMDELRFGAIDHPDTARVLHGVVSGVGSYGNSLGLPNIGGGSLFDSGFQGNPLVNALCVGVMKHEDIHLASAEGVGNKVVLFGARTGGDGIGGASILASETFEDGVPAKRPSVQVGDPFMEKVLIECCLELFRADVVQGIQDLGAAGISCATSELASNGSGGMHVWLDDVLLRDPSLNAGEILMSESQERMMAVVTPDKLEQFMEIAAKWDIESSVVGEVNDSGRLTIDHHGQRIVDVDPRTVAHEGPTYDRPYARPAWMDALQADHAADALALPSSGDDLRAAVLALMSSPNLADRSWITDQYDRYVQGNTALARPDTVGVVRVDEETGRGVAIATRSNDRFTKLDPYEGARQSVVAAYRAVAIAGATPTAITDGLNFGSPEDPDAMWQFVEAIRGLADVCAELGVPVTGGNVSLYNGTGEPGRIDSSINPTAIVGMLGIFDTVDRATPSGWRKGGQLLYLLGTTAAELDGSRFAEAHGHLGGLPPAIDIEAEKVLAEVMVSASRDGLIDAAREVGDGGLAAAVAQGALRYDVGARIVLDEIVERDGVTPAEALFSESQGRVLVALPREEEARLVAMLEARGVPAIRLGVTDDGADASLDVQDQFSLPLAELRRVWEAPLRARFA
ncbi:phosphoribosylformylglycinamidine synthase subunit PurL [Demequina muriae]|uniref:Phosphoribosylformylglycinamidine synthase subunit PurL n=1 Tax=Demequina muriae TaxID=3051664 RepID=A0ABT8GFW9_9MICO|nr:phosphoribosylformylglycinamidine synthase subunit PurL [Demequina sp. EGI L300058]MDN4480333.1 phosphoribosylformylglycinamidine synthase subunit PurL [Demequina sp. EGI L300058]